MKTHRTTGAPSGPSRVIPSASGDVPLQPGSLAAVSQLGREIMRHVMVLIERAESAAPVAAPATVGLTRATVDEITEAVIEDEARSRPRSYDVEVPSWRLGYTAGASRLRDAILAAAGEGLDAADATRGGGSDAA